VSDDGSRPSQVEDVHELALARPHVTVVHGTGENPVYQVGGKSFIFFRNPRPDAVDPETGERYPDVIVFWVASEADKQAMVQDEASPFFTTAHFDGHRRCCCGPVGSVRLADKNWQRSSTTRGCRAHQRAGRQPGSAHIRRRDHTRHLARATGRYDRADCGMSGRFARPDRSGTDVGRVSDVVEVGHQGYPEGEDRHHNHDRVDLRRYEAPSHASERMAVTVGSIVPKKDTLRATNWTLCHALVHPSPVRPNSITRTPMARNITGPTVETVIKKVGVFGRHVPTVDLGCSG
jgi:hypothetical protein